jgi:hypothetical protein
MALLTSTRKHKPYTMTKIEDSKKLDFEKIRHTVVEFFSTHFGKISAETLGWLAAIALHAATIPTLLALLTGLTDSTPSVDVVMFLWLGLVFLFGRAVILRDLLNIITIGLGFVIQSVLMALILFK